ncbi:MAG: hypothetical protein NTY74_12520 [Ignavibacteriae bacterium]|nr:hypothetical protein [Ignavibacteriota bacterium]
MNFILAKCPSCKGELHIPDDKDIIICMYCGTNIEVREAIRKSLNTNNTNLMKLIEEAIKNQNFTEAYEYCNKLLETDFANYLVWYYKAIVISRLAVENNLRIDETKSCFENALKYTPETKQNDIRGKIKEILYVISEYLYKLNDNNIRFIEQRETTVNIYVDNSKKIIRLLKFIPEELRIEENKFYEHIIFLCNRIINKHNDIFISETFREELNDIIFECNNNLSLLNPEKYERKDAGLLSKNIKTKKSKRNKRYIIFTAIVSILIFVMIATNPTEQMHKIYITDLMYSLIVKITTEVSVDSGIDNPFTNEKNVAAKIMKETMVTIGDKIIKIDNYLLFSIGSARLTTGNRENVTLGIFGKIYQIRKFDRFEFDTKQ